MRREQKRVLMPETQRRANSLENMTEGSIQKKKYYTCMCSDVFLYGEVIWKMGIQEIRNRKEEEVKQLSLKTNKTKTQK